MAVVSASPDCDISIAGNPPDHAVITGALTGLKADVAAGGLTFGAGMLVGGVIGGLAGVGVARGFNRLAGSEQPEVRWSADFLGGLVRSSVLRYLAVAHFGRGRGRYVEGEAPAFWRSEVDRSFAPHRAKFDALWKEAMQPMDRGGKTFAELIRDLQRAVTQVCVQALTQLYPNSVPDELRAETIARAHDLPNDATGRGPMTDGGLT